MDKLQWGNRKAPRRVKMKPNGGGGGGGGAGIVEKKISPRVVDDNSISNRHSSKEGRALSPNLPNRKPPMASLPAKEDKFYAKRGFEESSSKVAVKEENPKNVWPRLLISLSNKEKEEDFMVMKGCKPSQRPKKRAKLIQRALLLVSPGAWLSDVCRERYEVREKKTSKKKPRGLKAMGGMDFDSE